MMSRLKKKRSLTSLDIAVIVKELNDVVKDGWVDNIYSSDGGLLFKVRTTSGMLRYLIAVPGSRVNLTKHVSKSGIKGRVQIFRRFARNARITLVRQHEFERIVIAELRKSGKEMLMIVELMPRGVITIVEPGSMKVLVSDRDLRVKDRTISPGRPYAYPPTFPDPRKLDARTWAEKLSPYNELGKGLVRGLGLSPEIVNEVLDPSVRGVNPAELTLEELGKIRGKILDFIAEVVETPKPSLIYCEGTLVSFHPYIPSELPEGCEVRECETFNDAVDEYFSLLNPLTASGGGGESERMRATLLKARENVDRLREELRRIRSVLDLFEGKYDVIENSWRCVREKVKALGWGSARECPGVIEVNPSEGSFTISVEGNTIGLSVKKDVKEQYFDLRRREGVLRKKIETAEESL
jgi:predicted ribosome quality control (RQC) complex YloA/Tae2 family protein